MSFLALPSGGALHLGGLDGGPCVLFVHGVGGGAWSWEPQRAALAQAYRTAVWEARGHGEAARVDDAGLADYYADLREAADALRARGETPCIVAAHSMGGLLAIALACDRRDDVKALFLVDPVYADGRSESYGHMPRSAGGLALWLCEPILRSYARNGAISRVISRRLFALAFTDRARMEAAWVHQRTQVPVEYQRMLRESFTTPHGFDLRPYVEELDVPTMVLDCSRNERTDRVRFPEFVQTLARRLGDRFSSRVMRGGHYLQLDDPDGVTDELTAFVTRVRDRDS